MIINCFDYLRQRNVKFGPYPALYSRGRTLYGGSDDKTIAIHDGGLWQFDDGNSYVRVEFGEPVSIRFQDINQGTVTVGISPSVRLVDGSIYYDDLVESLVGRLLDIEQMWHYYETEKNYAEVHFLPADAV